MCVAKRIVFLFAVLLASLPACAEKTSLAAPPRTAIEDLLHARQAGDKSVAERDVGYEPASGSDIQVGLPESARKTVDSRDGLHWATDGQRPVLQYRFSEDGVMRIRGAGGGAAVSFKWGF